MTWREDSSAVGADARYFTTMAYYLPSYIQKRALRFALSYLDFVETDDLDFDKLGVTVGMRNVIELKDVGFRIKVR